MAFYPSNRKVINTAPSVVAGKAGVGEREGRNYTQTANIKQLTLPRLHIPSEEEPEVPPENLSS